jgi:hypothetical protein
MKRTDWYSWQVNPVRVGLYETSIIAKKPVMLYWNGQRWLTSQEGLPIAFCFPYDFWRGLTEPTA